MLHSNELRLDAIELQSQIKALTEQEQEVPAELIAQYNDIKLQMQNAEAEELQDKQSIIINKEEKLMDKELFKSQFKAFIAGKQDAFMDTASGNNGAVTADGGALVPQELLGLAEVNAVETDLRQICTVVPVGTRSGSVPVINYGQTVALASFDENNAMTETKAVFASKPFTLASKGAIIPVSRELIMDANTDPVAVVGNLFGNVYMSDVNASICATVEAAATALTASDAAAAVDEIKKQVISLPGKATVVLPKAVWGAMAILKNSTKGYLLAKDANGATVKQIEGADVVVVEDAAMTANTVLVGDFSTLYHVENPGIEVASSEEAGFARNSCLVRCIARYADLAIFPAALAKITIG